MPFDFKAWLQDMTFKGDEITEKADKVSAKKGSLEDIETELNLLNVDSEVFSEAIATTNTDLKQETDSISEGKKEVIQEAKNKFLDIEMQEAKIQALDAQMKSLGIEIASGDVYKEFDKEKSEIKELLNSLDDDIEISSNTKQFGRNELLDNGSDNGSEVQVNKAYYDDNGEKYREGNSLKPNATFVKNGYTYRTDEFGRVISVEGKLQVKDHKGRNKMLDTRDVVAHGKMKDSDDRGHLIADRFNGSGELENLVPMDGKLNKGDYAKLEDELAEAVKEGADVRMKVELVYSENSKRPDEFRVSYTIDGKKKIKCFKNRGENNYDE